MRSVSYYLPGDYTYPTMTYYDNLQGRGGDSTRFSYGGYGLQGSPGTFGPECDFMFPGASDSLNWGVGCKLPNGPVNWTERTAGIPPYEVRGMGSMGPFTFHPGDVEEVDIAFIIARDYTGSDTTYPSVNKLREMIDIIRNAFITNRLPNGFPFLGMNFDNRKPEPIVHVYPNPASSSAAITFDPPLHEPVSFQLIDSQGRAVCSAIINTGITRYAVDMSELTQGLYLVNIVLKDRSIIKKITVVR